MCLTDIFVCDTIFNKKEGDFLEVYERIKFLRKEKLHMTQDEFSSQIRISRSNLGSIEIGRVNVTERVLDDICSAFNVNKDWLINGNEKDEIFIDVTPSEKAYNRFGYIMENSSPSKKAALSVLLELLYSVPDEQWDAIMKQYDEIKKEG